MLFDYIGPLCGLSVDISDRVVQCRTRDKVLTKGSLFVKT
jgi:hypothetical protein